MDIIFVEPSFPANQHEFVRALHTTGARIIGVGERPVSTLSRELREQLFHYEQIANVCDEAALEQAVRWCQQRGDVRRLEATVEAHVMSTARVREKCGIEGTSIETAFLCRDKPAMKEALRQQGVACAASTGTSIPDEARAFARRVGFPLVLKPVDAAGAAGTFRVDNDAELEQAIVATQLSRGAPVAIEEFVTGHEGFYDTLTVGGHVVHDFVCHYYPNVLEAMRERWISPQFIATNRLDKASGYEELKVLGKKVNDVLGIHTSATHMEWFFGPKGLKFSEIGCRPPGVGCWDLYSAANEMDLYKEWAQAVVHGRVEQQPTRRYAAGIIALRPDRDGVISHYDGLEEIERRYGEHMIDAHFPSPGAPTRPVSAGYMANAWMRLKHQDFDTLREMMDDVGRTVKVHAR